MTTETFFFGHLASSAWFSPRPLRWEVHMVECELQMHMHVMILQFEHLMAPTLLVQIPKSCHSNCWLILGSCVLRILKSCACIVLAVLHLEISQILTSTKAVFQLHHFVALYGDTLTQTLSKDLKFKDLFRFGISKTTLGSGSRFMQWQPWQWGNPSDTNEYNDITTISHLLWSFRIWTALMGLTYSAQNSAIMMAKYRLYFSSRMIPQRAHCVS